MVLCSILSSSLRIFLNLLTNTSRLRDTKKSLPSLPQQRLCITSLLTMSFLLSDRLRLWMILYLLAYSGAYPFTFPEHDRSPIPGNSNPLIDSPK